MRLWQFRRSADEGKDGDEIPMPQVGERVQIQAIQEGHLSQFPASVEALGLRRIFLQSAEAPPIVPKTPILCSFARGEALYRFETWTLGPARSGGLTLARPRQVTRVQRRHYYRVSVETPTTFRLLTEHGSAVLQGPQAARLVNLSGGGALLAASKPLPSGTWVHVHVPAGVEGQSILVDAECLDCRIASQGTARVFLIRLRFAAAPRLPDEDRQEIIAYIFEQQRIMLRNRKLLSA